VTNSRGSEWVRWDVQIHTPGTALADQYPANSWDDYIARINGAAPPVEALGVTDYLSLRGYKALRGHWLAKRLPPIKFIFPNIEFRVSPPTKKHKGVNIHLLIDPSTSDHVERVEGALARLSFEYGPTVFNCDERGLTRFGRELDPAQRDDEAAYRKGVNEFKIDFSKLRDWFRHDPWLTKHCLIAVSNNEHDGVSGLPGEHGYAATIEEMYRFAQIVFSGNPNDRRYWLGKGADSVAVIERRFGGIKPCLHGCDAHELNRVLAPNNARFCWIKAEATFEGLRQVVFEPEERVHIGPDRPSRPRQNWIRSVTVRDKAWFPSESIELNEGLVAIIGPRGSGKTALADLIAQGADAFESGPASFLRKALPQAAGTAVELTWADRDDPVARVVGEEPLDYPSVRYLSQHFVEQLCSAEGASERLIDKIEEVIFEALDETDRSGASSFSELRNLVTEASHRRIQVLRSDIAQCSEEVAREQAAKADVPTKRDRLKTLDAEVANIGKSLAGLVVKGKENKGKTLQQLREEMAQLETVVADLKSKQRRIAELRLDLEQRERLNAEGHERMKVELLGLGVAERDLAAFRLRFDGDFDGILLRRTESIAKEIAIHSEGARPPRDDERPLAVMRKEIEALQKEIGGDTVRERQLMELQKKQKAKQQERNKLYGEIKRADLADNVIKETQKRRLDRYLELFGELSGQRVALGKLYMPLGERLSTAPPERKKLEFFVRQVVDIRDWADRGEQLLDLRRKGEFFQEAGSLAKKAEELLGNAWQSGDVEQIRKGMSAFLELFKDAGKFLAPTATLANFADWLFSTDHVCVTYGIRYEDTDIERLSPGTRGIALLILYLALDTQDDRPLIIDQPEENLDPQSVFEVLTGYFRETRNRRQVIVVTHNPNLVVNTDSDQVIIASSERVPGEALPHISYEWGGLENPRMRTGACRILEGGEEAFRKREKRYALERNPNGNLPRRTP